MHIDWNRYRVETHEAGRSRWIAEVPENLTPHFVNPDHDLWVPFAGAARVRLPAGWHTMKPGSCIWLRPGTRYEVQALSSEPFEHSFIHFALIDVRGRKYPARGPLPPEAIDPPDGNVVEALVRRIVDLCFGLGPQGMGLWPYPQPSASIASAMLTGLLMELDAGSESPKGRLQRAQDARIRAAAISIAEHCAQPHPVAELARTAGYSRNHFTVLFRQLTGHTPEQYAVRVRLQRAEQFLASTDLSIGEIAARLGYGDIYAFSHQFKKFKGVSPQVWRRRPSAGPGVARHGGE